MAMMITNISGAAISLPYPYYGVLGPGHGIVFEDTEANIVANLGGAEVIDSLFKLTAVPGAGINPISTQQNPPVNVSQITGNLPLTQTSGNLPTTRVSGQLPTTQLSGILTASQIASQADATYYVDAVLGNDANAGTALAPFKTIGAATALIPHVLNHNFTINIKAGTYVEEIKITTHIQAPGVLLSFIGLDWSLITPATGVQSGTFTSVSTRFITMAAAGWTVNDLKGKFVKVTSGAQSGKYFPIASNTIDTLEITASNTTVTAFNGQTFELCMQAASIEPSPGTPITIRVPESRAASNGGAVILQNLKFVASNTGSYGALNCAGLFAVVSTSCLFRSKTTNSNIIQLQVTGAGVGSFSFCVADVVAPATGTNGIQMRGPGTLTLAGCFIWPGSLTGIRAIDVSKGASLTANSNTIIEGWKSSTGVQGCGVMAMNAIVTGGIAGVSGVIIRDCRYGILLYDGFNTIGLVDSEISACVQAAIDMAQVTNATGSSAKGSNRIIVVGASKLINNLADAIRISTAHNHISLIGTTDISGNAGWGVNMVGAGMLDSAFNQVHVSSTFTAGTNTLGDFSIDGSAALTLAALRALPGKLAVDANFFHRLFSE